MRKPSKAVNNHELLRYIINGIVATSVHYAVLNINLHLLLFPSAGLANFIAALFGIIVSFLGSRYFVFQEHSQSIGTQAIKFGILYGSIACLHGLVLYFWTDQYQLNYHAGFIIATGLQVVLSYVGTKFIVFTV